MAGRAFPTVRAAEVDEVVRLPVHVGVGREVCGVRGQVRKEDGRRGCVRVPHGLGVLDECVGLGGRAGGAPFRRGTRRDHREVHLWMLSW